MHGKGTDKYDNVRIGLNSRLDTLQAAILLAKLDHFDEEIAARQRVAATYGAALAPLGQAGVAQHIPAGATSAWAQYSLLARNGEARAAAQTALKAAGVPTAVYYPTPLHLQTAFAHLGYRPATCLCARTSAAAFSACPCTPTCPTGRRNPSPPRWRRRWCRRIPPP